MFTIFAVPRAFSNPKHAEIQHKAIRSWLSLKPRPEIILIGDEEGIKEVCEQYGLRHIPYIRKSEYGVPYLSSAIKQAVQHASYDILCYVNADIVINSNLTLAISTVKEKKWKKFLMVSQPYVIDFSVITHFDPGFEKEILSNILFKPYTGAGGDLFAFTKKTYTLEEIPDFALGRGYFDFWFCTYPALHLIPTVNATDFVITLHPADETSTHYVRQSFYDQLSDRMREQLLANLLKYPFITATPKTAFSYSLNPRGELLPNPAYRGLSPVLILWLRMLFWEIRFYTIWRRNLAERWDLSYLREMGVDEQIRVYGLGHAAKRLLKFAKVRLRLS